MKPRHKPCWISEEGGAWQKVRPSSKVRLSMGSAFRLLPPTTLTEHQRVQKVQFFIVKSVAQSLNVDQQYLLLLRTIEREGKPQKNNKGTNLTLPRNFTLEIDLASKDGLKDLLPIITLRRIYHQMSKIEAIWYLRGEANIKFLQDNKCSFWDAQADGDGFLGGLN